MYPEQRANITASPFPEKWRRHPFVAKLERYAGLDSTDLHNLWQLVESDIAVKKRRDLVVDGYEYNKLCFVEQGFAARYKLLRNGKRQIVGFILPGDVIGLLGSFTDTARYSVVAVTDMKMQICTMSAYVQLCYKRPQFGLALSWLAIHEAIMYAEHIIDTGRRTPVERLAHFLLEIHSRLATAGCATEDEFVAPISQEIMSDALGLSVPHLNRTLAKLRSDGLIALEGHRVTLINREALEQLGHFQPYNMIKISAMAELPHDHEIAGRK
jgi:CRP-like cAMP-binding protein